jgi:hypothetical protein
MARKIEQLSGTFRNHQELFPIVIQEFPGLDRKLTRESAG